MSLSFSCKFISNETLTFQFKSSYTSIITEKQPSASTNPVIQLGSSLSFAALQDEAPEATLLLATLAKQRLVENSLFNTLDTYINVGSLCPNLILTQNSGLYLKHPNKRMPLLIKSLRYQTTSLKICITINTLIFMILDKTTC